MASPWPSLYLLPLLFSTLASFSDLVRWLPTYSGWHNPRFKTRIEENTLFFHIPSKISQVASHGISPCAYPWTSKCEQGCKTQARMESQTSPEDTCYPWTEGGEVGTCPPGKTEIQKRGWVLGEQLVCCSYMTITLSRTRCPSLSLTSGPNMVPWL